MSINQIAQRDFDRALNKGFWRRILNRLRGESNELLPFEEVRSQLPIRSQHYSGLQQVEIEKIVGSLGRYHDFDRAFLPTQRRTRDRWLSIDKANIKDVPLPPVELFKIGEVYFVKDGNHRVSVARERGQTFIDAYVIEIDTPVQLTPDTRVDELDLKKAHAEFLVRTDLDRLCPDSGIEASSPAYYERLLEHIDVHRWYLGEQRGSEPSFEEAVSSWYDTVYLPLREMIREQGLLDEFSKVGETDLYLWIMEYQGYLRQAYRCDWHSEDKAQSSAARQLLKSYPQPVVKKLVGFLEGTGWLRTMILSEERVEFLENTGLSQVRPQAEIEATLPGQYDALREHIEGHRWYLGEQQKTEVAYEDALVSWYETVYMPIVELIREKDMLKEFPDRTETDLYLWIIRHQWSLWEEFGEEVPIEKVTDHIVEDHAPGSSAKSGKKK